MDLHGPGLSSRAAALTVAAMYAGGGSVGLLESATPGGPRFSVVPSWIALALAGFLATVGPRLPRTALASLGPLGVVLIAYTLVTRQGSGDGALLYVWPVLWTSYFYGRAGTALIVAWVGGTHAAVVRSFPDGLDYVGRWLDVMVAVTVVAVVIQILVRRAYQLLARLESSEAQFRELADGTPDIVFRFSRLPDPHFEYLSPSFESITGVPVSTVKADLRQFAVGHDDAGAAGLADLIADRNFRPQLDLAFRRVDGTAGVFQLHVVETADGVQGIARDVTEIRALQAQLTEQATCDPLTGLANRRLLDELLGRALRRAERSGTLLTVAFLDLDGFKSINDSHGHDAGDAVLRATAARIQTAVRDADVVARYGGDEFVVVYEGADDDTARTLVERVHDAMSAPIEVGGGVTVRCCATVGLADTRRTAPNASALIGAADRAMLEAKRQLAPLPQHGLRPQASEPPSKPGKDVAASSDIASRRSASRTASSPGRPRRSNL